jgi:hypothetical protein
MGISQVEGPLMSDYDAADMTVIEKKFFNNKQADPCFSTLFHNGGLQSVTLISNSAEYLAQSERYKIKNCSYHSELDINALFSENQFVIVFLDSPST